MKYVQREKKNIYRYSHIQKPCPLHETLEFFSCYFEAGGRDAFCGNSVGGGRDWAVVREMSLPPASNPQEEKQ